MRGVGRLTDVVACFHVLVLLASSVAAAGNIDAVAELPFGSISGNLLSTSKEFLGIPYAPQPKRFSSAQLWSRKYDGGHLEAKRYKPWCLQADPGLRMPAPTFSEDCHYLTMYTPRQDRDASGEVLATSEGPWPVMVWIHGGSLAIGSAMAINYNASVLASKGRVVVVACSYRLGVFGFSTVAASEEAGARTVSNQGFRDQRVCMTWVKRHIVAFGGEPTRITLFGESAGGGSVAVHLVSKASWELFDGAIVQSGDILLGRMPSLERSKLLTDKVARAVNCVNLRDLHCLQRVPGDEILNASLPLNANFDAFSAVIDDDVLVAAIPESVKRGDFNRVPVIIGTLKDEANAFMYPPWYNTPPANASVFECMVNTGFGTKASAIFDLYSPVDEHVDHRPLLSKIQTDIEFRCPARTLSMALAAAGSVVWVYVFNRRAKCPFGEQYGFMDMPGAVHGNDVAFVFDNIPWLMKNLTGPYGTACIPAPSDNLLADKVADLWTSFATSGKAQWPHFQIGDEQALKIDLGTITRLETDMGHGRFECDLWESLDINLDTLNRYGGLIGNPSSYSTVWCHHDPPLTAIYE